MGLMLYYEKKQFEKEHGAVAIKRKGKWVTQQELFEKDRTNYAKSKAMFRRLK